MGPNMGPNLGPNLGPKVKSRGDPKEIQNTNCFVLRKKKVLTFENGTQGPKLGPKLGPIFKSQHIFLKTKDSEQ